MDVSQVSPQTNATPTVTLGAKPASTDKGAKPAPSEPKPAAKVDISAQARAKLVAAGASNEAVATTNLKDSTAVTRAVNKAKAAHAAHHEEPQAPGKPAASAEPGKPSGK